MFAEILCTVIFEPGNSVVIIGTGNNILITVAIHIQGYCVTTVLKACFNRVNAATKASRTVIGPPVDGLCFPTRTQNVYIQIIVHIRRVCVITAIGCFNNFLLRKTH